MPLRFVLSPAGRAELNALARRLRAMNEPAMAAAFRRQLRAPAVELQLAIRANIFAIPAESGAHSGLRARLARCVRVTSRTTGKEATVAVFMDVHRMPSGQYALPLTMEGLKLWLHPVFNPLSIKAGANPIVVQSPHPYFYPVVAARGGEFAQAVERAVDEITAFIEHG